MHTSPVSLSSGLSLKIPEPPFFVFTGVLKILGAVVLAPSYRSLRRRAAASLFIPRWRIGCERERPQTNDGQRKRESATGTPGEIRAGKGTRREGERETCALTPQTKTRRNRIPHHAHCGNNRASTKRPTRSLSCARDMHRVVSRVVACVKLRGTSRRCDAAGRRQSCACVTSAFTRSLVRFVHPCVLQLLDNTGACVRIPRCVFSLTSAASGE